MCSSYLKTFFSAGFLQALPSDLNSFPTASPRSEKFNSPFKTWLKFYFPWDMFWPSSCFWKKITCSTLSAPITQVEWLYHLRPSYTNLLLFSLWSRFIHFLQLITRPKFTFLFQLLGPDVLQSSGPCVIYPPPWGLGQHSDQTHGFCMKI